MAEQNIGVRIVGKDQASKEILGVGSALERMKTSVETNRAGLNKLDNALKDSAANMLGLQGTAGRLADALFEFAPGGIVGGLAVAGIGLLINSFMSSREEQEKSRESLNKYLDSQIKLNYAIDQFNVGEPDASFKHINEQLKVLPGRIYNTDQEIKKLQATFDDIARFEREQAKGGLLSRLFLGIDPVSATYTRAEIQKTKDAFNEASVASNELLTQQAELMLKMKNIGMQQLDRDIARLGTLRELGKVGRLTAAEQQEQVYLTTKLTNLSNTLGADAEVRLKSFKALGIELVNHAEQQRKYNEAGRQQLDLFKQIQESAVKRFEAEAQAERIRRQGMRDVISQDLQKQLEGLGASIEKQFEGFGVKDFETRMQGISQLAYNISDGFDVMTEAIMQGNNAFKSLEMGARAAARNILRSFAQEQIAKGIGAIGSALTATATGNFPSAGLFYQSAAKHFAAAAAAGFAGGAIGGGGSNRGGGGGGGFSNSNLGRGGAATGGPIYITISGGGILDMNNPETARAFANAIQTSTNRRTVILGR